MVNPDAINPDPQDRYPIEGVGAALPLFGEPEIEWVQVFGLHVPYRPRTRGSKVGHVPINRKTGKPFRRPNGTIICNVLDSDKHSGVYMQRLALLAMKHWKREPIPADIPVALQVCFYFKRAESHYGTGANAGKLKASAPMFMTQKPDVSKAIRCLEDALNEKLWADDKQICDYLPPFGKRYSADGRAEYTELRVFIPSDCKLPAEDRF